MEIESIEWAWGNVIPGVSLSLHALGYILAVRWVLGERR